MATKQHLLGLKGENYKSHFLTEYNLSIMTCESIKMLQKCPPNIPQDVFASINWTAKTSCESIPVLNVPPL